MPESYRVVIALSDPSAAHARARSLQVELSATVTLSSASALISTAASARAEVVVVDALTLESAVGLRAASPSVRVAVLSPEPTLSEALRAMRFGAHDLLDARITFSEFAAHLRRLAEDHRADAARARAAQRVLAIGAHPDDVEAGVGGILAAHRAAGDSVTILTLSKGRREGGVELAWTEASSSAAVIGAELLFEDREMNFSALLAAITPHVAARNPTIVYTHSKQDRRQDHRLVHEAAVAASEEIATVACFQGTTGTTSFKPTRFVPVDAVMERKLEMLSHFASRGARPTYLAPDFVLASARYWSQFGHGEHCEPLEIIRESVTSPVAPVASSTSESQHTGELATTPGLA
ncbi:PIG-L family deacetylase [uncultured Schumannella sp.]|uniref:PIG-L family deacetylase n=1 Tax=uncultured Schumannella sp. TaxID=1195956 RepID=UPI0025D455E8|nr:PIG-L family deacetylase [uncultured Schumannella sp.]